MEYNKINNLLDSYFEGETTLENEATLREYFQNKEIDGRLKVYAPIFKYAVEEAKVKMREDFDHQLLNKLEIQNPKETRVRSIQLLYRAAAVIIFVMVAGWAINQYINHDTTQDNFADTYDNPEEALEEALAALELVSSKLNKGMGVAAEKMKKVEESTRSIRNL